MAEISGVVATRSSWSVHPPPVKRAALRLGAAYDQAECARIRAGLVPEDMDDKWFMFFEEPWLYVHHSWSGFCIYGVRFEASPDGSRIVESWANRNEAEWGATSEEHDARFLQFLIDALLVHKPVPFPGAASPLTQHILIGRVLPEE